MKKDLSQSSCGEIKKHGDKSERIRDMVSDCGDEGESWIGWSSHHWDGDSGRGEPGAVRSNTVVSVLHLNLSFAWDIQMEMSKRLLDVD